MMRRAGLSNSKTLKQKQVSRTRPRCPVFVRYKIFRPIPPKKLVLILIYKYIGDVSKPFVMRQYIACNDDDVFSFLHKVRASLRDARHRLRMKGGQISSVSGAPLHEACLLSLGASNTRHIYV